MRRACRRRPLPPTTHRDAHQATKRVLMVRVQMRQTARPIGRRCSGPVFCWVGSLVEGADESKAGGERGGVVSLTRTRRRTRIALRTLAWHTSSWPRPEAHGPRPGSNERAIIFERAARGLRERASASARRRFQSGNSRFFSFQCRKIIQARANQSRKAAWDTQNPGCCAGKPCRRETTGFAWLSAKKKHP